jgi:hypothetical protein
LQAKRSSKLGGVLSLYLGLRGGQLACKLSRRSSLACLSLKSLLELQLRKGINSTFTLNILKRAWILGA